MYDVDALLLRVVKEQGDEVLCYCPFHDDKTPTSFFFNIKTGAFICFACGESGGIDKLSKRTGGLITEKERFHHYQNQKLDLSAFFDRSKNSANSYTESRGVSTAMIKEFGIRTNQSETIFPIIDTRCHLLALQVRYKNGNPRYRYFGEHVPFYPYQPINPNQPLFIVEGVFGVVRCYQSGGQAITFFGCKKTPDDIAKTILLNHQSNVIIYYDNDLSGIAGSNNLNRILGGSCLQMFGEADELPENAWQKHIKDNS